MAGIASLGREMSFPLTLRNRLALTVLGSLCVGYMHFICSSLDTMQKEVKSHLSLLLCFAFTRISMAPPRRSLYRVGHCEHEYKDTIIPYQFHSLGTGEQ